MNIVRVPFRVSLFGGGTDFKYFYSKKNATVISFTIDRYCYISVRELLPFFKTKYRLSWSKIEEVADVNDFTHPSVKACLNHLKIKDPLEIHTVGDLPARSGLGSSSSFTAAFLTALTLYKKESFNADKIAKQTIFIEQEILKENVGIQDQIQVCHGGFNITSIFSDSSYSILSLNNSSNIVREIGESLILVYSNIQRSSSEVHNLITPRIPNHIKKDVLKEINFLAEKFSSKLKDHTADFNIFISLLKDSWELKSLTLKGGKNNEILQSIYKKGLDSGALCGKLLGAGEGGFFAFFVTPKLHEEFKNKMSPLLCVTPKISFKGIEQVL